jgi:heptosyltransferase-3
VKNLLVIKLRYLGDVLLATPALRALKDGFPKARLSMLVNPGTEDLLRRNPDVDEVLTLERGGPGADLRFALAVRRRSFDCVVDLTDSDRSAIVGRLSGAPVRIGFNDEHRWRGLLYTSVVSPPPHAHRIEHDLEAVRALGLAPKVSSPALYVGAEDDEAASRLLRDLGLDEAAGTPLALLHPGARYWFKAWPPERFAELAERLVGTTGCRILVAGDAREQALADAIRRRTRVELKILTGRTTLLQLAAILKRCALFIGNDNGPMHMAAALGVRIVALFGPSDPATWGPRTDRAVVLYKGLDCRRCFHPTCDRGEESCMKQISVDEVLAAAQRLLRTKG